MTGKVCIVTGASSGIGRETALALARLGASVVLVCRDAQRGEAAIAQVRAAGDHGGSAHLLLGDLSSQADIRRIALEFAGCFGRLDVLVNNAGVWMDRRVLTPEGYETNFAVNHLAPFLLTNLLLPVLEESGSPGTAARVVTVSSAAHNAGRIDFEDLHAERKRYSGWGAYSQSKLANVLFSNELARRTDPARVTSNALHPGLVRTRLDQNSRLFRWAGIMARRAFVSPEQGARTSIYLACSPEVEGVTGRYFAKEAEAKFSDRSSSVADARRLWEVSAGLTELSS